MSKLGNKIAVRISMIILSLLLCLFLMTKFLLPSYSLYQNKQKLIKISEEIKKTDKTKLLMKIAEWNNDMDVTVVFVPTSRSIEHLNDTVTFLLKKQGISLNRFWISAEVIQKLEQGQAINRIYDQRKQKSSFYVRFIQKDNQLIVIGISLVHMEAMIKMVNQFNAIFFILTLIITLIWVYIFSKRITQPIRELNKLAQEIAELKFQQVQIETRDEIEDLAKSINKMSRNLQQAHLELKKKNLNLKHLTSNLTHELKTPLALIQAYASGIQDDLDDGTYLETIISQTIRISDLIDELLRFVQLEQNLFHFTSLDPVSLWESCLNEHQVIFEREEIICSYTALPKEPWTIYADPDKLKMVFHNLLSNATKYTDNKSIVIHWSKNQSILSFHISNGREKEIEDLARIWDPFTVLADSRDKKKSGTGLGLAIVKSILDRHHYRYRVDQENGWFTLTIDMLLIT
ncbi:sensor histidine kinase [Shimazuella kribbensis]|uniref:sensor histidine kinase n=1 Tax=Shimazuella kribbensis TaxID=139808 RepID=UPI00040C921D|nr:HAMP domain-containing sensor histidine kinase [Shimazuella kribbensis]